MAPYMVVASVVVTRSRVIRRLVANCGLGNSSEDHLDQ